MSRSQTDGADSGSPVGIIEDASQDLHLWKLPRGRHGLPRELVARSQRERLIAAVVRATEEKGYRATSVADILKAAGVGRESFYRYFDNKEDCFLAANDVLVENLEAEVADAYNQPRPWPARIRGALAATLNWLAANPDIARVMMIEMGTVGPVAILRFRESFHRFTAMLEDGDQLADEAPDLLANRASIAGGAVFARVYEEVAIGNAEDLRQLQPQLIFELLLPYIGEEAAAMERDVAQKDLARRGDAS